MLAMAAIIIFQFTIKVAHRFRALSGCLTHMITHVMESLPAGVVWREIKLNGLQNNIRRYSLRTIEKASKAFPLFIFRRLNSISYTTNNLCLAPEGKVNIMNNLDICCPCTNTGVVDQLMENDVLAIFSGHDHDNDFSGFFRKGDKAIELVYGRKSGFASYGPKNLVVGATFIELQLREDVQYLYNR